MKPRVPKPAVFSVKGGELSLSRQALVELIQAVLAKGARFRFRAKGLSMHPAIRDGDLLTISPLSDVSPCPGDVVAFVRKRTGNLIVHRVVSETGGFFLVRGDNMPDEDDLVTEADILGCVTKVERNE